MPSGLVTPNETDSFDIGVITDGVDRWNASVDNVENTRWQTYEN